MAPRGSLTGGTRDVNPQFLRGALTMTAADTYTELEIAIPVLRTTIAGQKAQVIEILGVYWHMTSGDGATASERIVTLATESRTALQRWGNTGTIFLIDVENHGAEAAGAWGENLSGFMPLHDGAGHGIIAASPSLFLGMTTVSETAAQSCDVAIQYRFKNIALIEFIGLTIAQGG